MWFSSLFNCLLPEILELVLFMLFFLLSCCFLFSFFLTGLWMRYLRFVSSHVWELKCCFVGEWQCCFLYACLCCGAVLWFCSLYLHVLRFLIDFNYSLFYIIRQFYYICESLRNRGFLSGCWFGAFGVVSSFVQGYAGVALYFNDFLSFGMKPYRVILFVRNIRITILNFY